jgi:hypothetical protein
MRIGLFAEDEGHRGLIRGVIVRTADEVGVEADIIERSATGGRGMVLRSLREYVSDLGRARDHFIDVLVVALDSNCKGSDMRRLVDKVVGGYAGKVVQAVPEPHIERWFLLDPHAPAAVLGETGMATLPAEKCERDRYKVALRQAFRDLGVDPPAGGVLYGEEIAQLMDLSMAQKQPDFAKFLDDLRDALKLVKLEEERLRNP